jgi:hypothetical protein
VTRVVGWGDRGALVWVGGVVPVDVAVADPVGAGVGGCATSGVAMLSSEALGTRSATPVRSAMTVAATHAGCH